MFFLIRLNYLFFTILPVLLCTNISVGQTNSSIKYKSITETYTVIDTIQGYESHTEIIGYTKNGNCQASVLKSEDEKILDFTLSVKKNGTYKKIKKVDLKVQDLKSSHFYTGIRSMQFMVPANINFKCSFTKTCRELMTLAYLPLYSNIPTSQYTYVIKVPGNLQLKYDIIHEELIKAFTVDTQIYKTETVYRFFVQLKSTPKLETLLLGNMDINLQVKLPFIRTIITPANYKGKESSYFNNWYLKKLKNRTNLDSILRKKITDLTYNVHDKDSIVDILFTFIRDNVKYIDIENGVNAYIPDSANSVFHNMYGDCKGMANLLCQCLNYKNIDASLAIAATNVHVCDMDFPSLIAGNHMICVIPDKKKHILDPTFKSGRYNTIPYYMQGRTIFITGKDTCEYYKVPVVPCDSNKIISKIRLTYNDNKLSGILKLLLTGYYQEHFLYEQKYQSTTEFFRSIKNQLSLPGSKTENIEFYSKKDTAVVHGSIIIPSSHIFYSENKYFLNLNFVPFPHSIFTTQLDSCFNLCLANTTNTQFELEIQLENPVNSCSFDTVTFNKNGLFFKTEYAIVNNTVKIRYQFILNQVSIDSEDFSSIKELHELFDKLFRNVIILE